MRHVFALNGAEHRLWLARDADGYVLHLDDGVVSVALGDGRLHVGGIEMPVHVARDGDRVFVHVDGNAHEVSYREPVAYHASTAAGGSQDVLRAPMPGVVLALSVTEGRQVAEGDLLLVIESMKLETAIRASRAGIVETIHVAPGKTFERDAALISLAPL